MPSLCEATATTLFPSLAVASGVSAPYEMRRVTDAEYIPFTTMLSGVLPQKSALLVSSRLFPELVNLIGSSSPPQIEVRGSIIPLAHAKQVNDASNKAFDTSVTHLMQALAPFAGLDASKFERNIDINIDAQNVEQMAEISKLLRSIGGIHELPLRPFLNQYAFPSIPNFFINVNTPLVMRADDASLYSNALGGEDWYWGRHADRDYAVSSKMHAARGKLVMKNGILQVEIPQEEMDYLLDPTKPDYFLVDQNRTPSMLFADLARNARFQGLVLGIEQVHSSLSSEINQTEIAQALTRHLANPSTMRVNDEDRATIIANYLPLLLLHPEAFAQFLIHRPFAFAACRFVHTDSLNEGKIEQLIEAGKGNDLDTFVEVLYNTGIILQRPEAENRHPDRPYLKDVVEAKIGSMELSQQQQVAKEIKQALQETGSKYTFQKLESLLTLLYLFDTHNPDTGEPFEIDTSSLQNHNYSAVAYRSRK